MEVQIRTRDRSKRVDNNAVKKVAITLNDCLACSGCITSAETVLIKVSNTLKLFVLIARFFISQYEIYMI